MPPKNRRTLRFFFTTGLTLAGEGLPQALRASSPAAAEEPFWRRRSLCRGARALALPVHGAKFTLL